MVTSSRLSDGSGSSGKGSDDPTIFVVHGGWLYGAQVTWFSIRGNHDWHGSPTAEIDYYLNKVSSNR